MEKKVHAEEPPSYSEAVEGTMGNNSVNVGHQHVQQPEKLSVPVYSPHTGPYQPSVPPCQPAGAPAPAVPYSPQPAHVAIQQPAVMVQPQVVTFSVSRYGNLGDKPCATTCPICCQRVITKVHYRSGSFSWLMCFVFIFVGMVCGCCLIPFFANSFRDAHHSCPNCHAPIYTHRRI